MSGNGKKRRRSSLAPLVAPSNCPAITRLPLISYRVQVALHARQLVALVGEVVEGGGRQVARALRGLGREGGVVVARGEGSRRWRGSAPLDAAARPSPPPPAPNWRAPQRPHPLSPRTLSARSAACVVARCVRSAVCPAAASSALYGALRAASWSAADMARGAAAAARAGESAQRKRGAVTHSHLSLHPCCRRCHARTSANGSRPPKMSSAEPTVTSTRP